MTCNESQGKSVDILLITVFVVKHHETMFFSVMGVQADYRSKDTNIMTHTYIHKHTQTYIHRCVSPTVDQVHFMPHYILQV